MVYYCTIYTFLAATLVTVCLSWAWVLKNTYRLRRQGESVKGYWPLHFILFCVFWGVVFNTFRLWQSYTITELDRIPNWVWCLDVITCNYNICYTVASMAFGLQYATAVISYFQVRSCDPRMVYLKYSVFFVCLLSWALYAGISYLSKYYTARMEICGHSDPRDIAGAVYWGLKSLNVNKYLIISLFV